MPPIDDDSGSGRKPEDLPCSNSQSSYPPSPYPQYGYPPSPYPSSRYTPSPYAPSSYPPSPYTSSPYTSSPYGPINIVAASNIGTPICESDSSATMSEIASLFTLADKHYEPRNEGNTNTQSPDIETPSKGETLSQVMKTRSQVMKTRSQVMETPSKEEALPRVMKTASKGKRSAPTPKSAHTKPVRRPVLKPVSKRVPPRKLPSSPATNAEVIDETSGINNPPEGGWPKDADPGDDMDDDWEDDEDDNGEDDNGDDLSKPTAVNNTKVKQKTKSGKAPNPNGRVVGRKLVMWHRDSMVVKLLLCLQYECHRRGVPLPWDAAVHRLSPGSSGQSALQHLNKLRESLISEGHMIPPQLGKVTDEEPRYRGHVRDFTSDYIAQTRTVDWAENLVNRKKSLDVPGIVRGSDEALAGAEKLKKTVRYKIRYGLPPAEPAVEHAELEPELKDTFNPGVKNKSEGEHTPSVKKRKIEVPKAPQKLSNVEGKSDDSEDGNDQEYVEITPVKPRPRAKRMHAPAPPESNSLGKLILSQASTTIPADNAQLVMQSIETDQPEDDYQGQVQQGSHEQSLIPASQNGEASNGGAKLLGEGNYEGYSAPYNFPSQVSSPPEGNLNRGGTPPHSSNPENIRIELPLDSPFRSNVVNNNQSLYPPFKVRRANEGPVHTSDRLQNRWLTSFEAFHPQNSDYGGFSFPNSGRQVVDENPFHTSSSTQASGFSRFGSIFRPQNSYDNSSFSSTAADDFPEFSAILRASTAYQNDNFDQYDQNQ